MADHLEQLAGALEKESQGWTAEYDISHRAQFPTRAYKTQGDERVRRGRFIWDISVDIARTLIALTDGGAFEHDPRAKRALLQMRAEMESCRKENKAPCYNPGRKRPAWPGSQPWSGKVEEEFLVKLFEGFCKIRATSFEDKRAFLRGYCDLKSLAALHAKLLRELSEDLKSRYAKSGV